MPLHGSSCRYQLTQTVRVHTGADDDAYSCMGWGPDREGINGVWLRKDVPLQVSFAVLVDSAAA
jgi:hypothetical protein